MRTMFRRGTCLLLALAVAASSMPLSWCIAVPPPSDPSHETIAPVADCSCCAQEACPCGCCDLPAATVDPTTPTDAPRCISAEAPTRLTTVIRCGCSPNRFFLLALTLFLDHRTETKHYSAPPADILEEACVRSASHFLPPDTPPPRSRA
jgi:hypothetical protein